MKKAVTIKADPRNYRLHPDANKRVIRKSLEDLGAGRSIVIDKEDCIIAGNGVYEEAQALGLPVRVVETDGRELIAVKRTDLGTADERRRLLAFADNHASDTSVFDTEIVVEDFSPETLDAWEFAVEVSENQFGGGGQAFGDGGGEAGEDNTYTKKIESPIYTPKGECPLAQELYDSTIYKRLMEDIAAAEGVDIETKAFLRIAAARHIVFDYGRIAEFYAHADKETQRLMEDSALVIIDFDRAVELGYVKLKSELATLREEDVPDE